MRSWPQERLPESLDMKHCYLWRFTLCSTTRPANVAVLATSFGVNASHMALYRFFGACTGPFGASSSRAMTYANKHRRVQGSGAASCAAGVSARSWKASLALQACPDVSHTIEAFKLRRLKGRPGRDVSVNIVVDASECLWRLTSPLLQ